MFTYEQDYYPSDYYGLSGLGEGEGDNPLTRVAQLLKSGEKKEPQKKVAQKIDKEQWDKRAVEIKAQLAARTPDQLRQQLNEEVAVLNEKKRKADELTNRYETARAEYAQFMDSAAYYSAVREAAAEQGDRAGQLYACKKASEAREQAKQRRQAYKGIEFKTGMAQDVVENWVGIVQNSTQRLKEKVTEQQSQTQPQFQPSQPQTGGPGVPAAATRGGGIIDKITSLFSPSEAHAANLPGPGYPYQNQQSGAVDQGGSKLGLLCVGVGVGLLWGLTQGGRKRGRR